MYSWHQLLSVQYKKLCNIGIYGVYHLILWLFTVYAPMRTMIGQNHVGRRAWCRALTGKTEMGILAVQTLRNGMLASQLLANTSFAILSALTVILVQHPYDAGRASYGLPPGSGIDYLADTTVLPPIKLFLLVLTFIFAFFFYLLSMRAYYHVTNSSRHIVLSLL